MNNTWLSQQDGCDEAEPTAKRRLPQKVRSVVAPAHLTYLSEIFSPELLLVRLPVTLIYQSAEKSVGRLLETNSTLQK